MGIGGVLPILQLVGKQSIADMLLPFALLSSKAPSAHES